MLNLLRFFIIFLIFYFISNFYIFKILKLACKNNGRSITPAENTVSKILEYINQNISTKLTLNILCESFHISKCYLCHIFKASTGLTVYEYILSIRLAKGKQLLTDTDMSVSEIALQCGFSDFSYFSKAFRASEGITPRQYRQISHNSQKWHKNGRPCVVARCYYFLF